MADSIWATIAAAVAEMPNPKLDNINPHFKSKFASLKACDAAVKPSLKKHGLAYKQTAEGAELVTHVYGSEVVEMSRVPLSVMTNPQGNGSSLTYARRYGLCAAFGLVGEEDDDGEQAEKAAKETTAAPQKPQTASDAVKAMREAIKAYMASHGLTYEAAMEQVTAAVGEVQADSPIPKLREATEWLRANA